MENSFSCNAAVNLPYPPIKPKSQNRSYAIEILSNVGGSNSEMNAVSLYFFNHVILAPNYSAFEKCFNDISIVEMHHLDMFAELAFKLGAEPRLWSIHNHRRVYWTPAYNKYPQEIHEVINNSINSEEAAIQKYEKQSETIEDANIVALLKRIIMDEENHIKIFNNMKENIK